MLGFQTVTGGGRMDVSSPLLAGNMHAGELLGGNVLTGNNSYAIGTPGTLQLGGTGYIPGQWYRINDDTVKVYRTGFASWEARWTINSTTVVLADDEFRGTPPMFNFGGVATYTNVYVKDTANTHAALVEAGFIPVGTPTPANPAPGQGATPASAVQRSATALIVLAVVGGLVFFTNKVT